MGGRVEGKTKKKSIKAKVTSKFGSKRKLSRMGKKVQKGHAGASAEFITRSAAIRKLQITLKDFRRLCILKGIYPRVPAKAPSGGDKIYYDIKDISYIMHEPLLDKFREFKAFMKKIRRAAGRNQFQDARRQNELAPKMSLDHLVKERYPRFIDALRDMDDALCMIHLFAALPSVGRITAERTANCARLAREWQYYVAKSHALKKVFVSVKGIYYQAEIMGEPITWLAPHQFTQTLPKEVDYRVMLTFLEFYEVFVKFALFKLYHMQGMQYPPLVDKSLESVGSCLLSMKSDSTQQPTAASSAVEIARPAVEAKTHKANSQQASQISTLAEKLQEIEDEEDDDEDGVDISAPLNAAFSDLQNLNDKDSELETKTFGDKSDSSSSLFGKLTFFINREVPLEWLQFCVTAFGGRVGWDSPNSPIKMDDAHITHHVIDRPVAPNGSAAASESREYVQPQWVFDSINAQMLLPARLYAPGAKLPPHLSPFVDDDKEGYVPRFREEIKALQVDAGLLEPAPEDKKSAEQDEHDSEDEEENFGKKSQQKKKQQQKKKPESDSEGSDDEKEQLDELPAHKGHKAIVYATESAFQDEASEMHALSKTMMGKKTKRLYDRMQHGINEKKEAVNKLESKRKALENDQAPQQSKKTKKTK